MAKKKIKVFKVSLTNNFEKGGGWLCHVRCFDQDHVYEASFSDVIGQSDYSAWKNASAAKRHAKALAQKWTTKKSVKFIAGSTTDSKGKPASFNGEFTFKVDA